VRSALTASGLALPARRITVNLAPADLPKEGSHKNASAGEGSSVDSIRYDELNTTSVSF
jgi:magnesium chelatase family protein